LIQRFTILGIIILIVTTCARISSPGGGEEDLDPPVLIRSIPENGQINFREDKITLYFNEIVSTNQIESNLIITPTPKGSFRTRNNRNLVELTFFEPFDDSTTYTFSFANTIQDVTARNPASDLTLSFSTGDYLDSLSISGQILNLYDQLPSENIIVSLFHADDSLNVLNGNAQYYTKTDTAGLYTFRNLPPNTYKVYAFEDKNGNNKADSDGELYGFYANEITLTENKRDIDFTIQRLSTKPLRLISSGQFGPYYQLNFNKSITSFTPISSDDFIYFQTADDQVRFYRTNQSYNDTTDYIFQATDSVGTIVIDTASIFFSESDIETDQLTQRITPDKTFLKPAENITLKFNKPIILINYDSIQFSLDSLNRFPFPEQTVSTSEFNSTISWPLVFQDYSKRPDQELTLTFKKGAFYSIDGDTNKTFTQTYSPALIDESALISGQVNGAYSNIIVQLLNNRTLEVVDEQYSTSFSFDYLNAGSYTIRVILDLNGNGQWDIGNITTNTPPEPALFYVDETYNSQLIEVRKNWAREGLIISIR
jgi:uncharacterized protein (DUF2141 family)